jgi:hypothetical protein
MQEAYTEGLVQLAIQSLNTKQITSAKRAAASYNVPRTTLRRRRAGTQSRRDCQPNSKKLTKIEEDVIVERILDRDSRGWAFTKKGIEEMANTLLAERGGGVVGKNWVDNFIKRQSRLKTQWSRSYDRQRALTEDPRVISPWFTLVKSFKEKHGIQDDDIYNFDESGFMMGVIASQMLVIGSERRGKRKAIQPGNREWVTVICSINATGWAIPPFIIFAGRVHISSWYEDKSIPRDWVIELSSNGWTTNELGIAWLKHFNKHTEARTRGTHRLLIIDGHESHHSLEFDRLCKELNIITLCMPSHSSHLLQPLDVGCFSPLKRAYGNEVSGLARNHTNHIAKETFLQAFKAAYNKAFTKDNICASFRGAGLVPHDPEAVLSKLDIKLRTPTPAISEDLPWQSQTPSNAREIEAQSTLIRDRLRRHKSSSPTSIIESINRLEKGSAKVMHDIALMRKEMRSLREAAEIATKRKSRKRKYIRNQETLTVGEMADLVAPNEVGGQEENKKPENKVRIGRRCRRCGNIGHNSRTCQVEIEDSEDSDGSE